MNRWIWLAPAIVVLIAAGVTLVALPRTPEWTTSSPEALTEFEAGQAEWRKIYHAEAREHFKRAYELDPDFLVAKLRVARILDETDPERADQMFAELMTADLSQLTPREKFFIEYWRANHSGRREEASRLLDQCVERLPSDPYILAAKADVEWSQGNLKEVENLYKDLLEIDPNWVLAHNNLGYIKMIQGRFAEAEAHFKSYRYIAPDQANPHDSLGELFITTGRYDEAESTLERAVEIKPDFWASYFHLAVLKAYVGDFEAVQNIIERARGAEMAATATFEMDCRARFAELADRAEWRQILEERTSECITEHKLGFPSIITHRAACRTGDWETAQKLEDDAAGQLLEIENRGNSEGTVVAQASVLHMQGVRLASQGDFGNAAERFRAVDDRLSFMFVEQGMFKLHNKILLAETLLAAHQDAEAHELLAAVRRINPPMVQEFEDTGFRFLGLGSRLPPDSTRLTEEVKPQRSRMSL